MTWSREEILTATGGRLLRDGTRRRFGEVVTDSSKVGRGSVFVALKGARLDGHRFVREALERGAECVIVHRKVGAAARKRATVVYVPDTLKALGDLAHYRRQNSAAKVIAITGSNGKTTTKEMLTTILEESSSRGKGLRGTVLKTEGNFNNLVGLPLTLLRLRPKHRVAVVELGTNHPGEIDRLTRIANPDMGIITSVAAAHLEGLSSLAGVAREKGALYRAMDPTGAIAVNTDDPRVRRLGEKFKGRKITYGTGGEVCAEARQSLGARGVRFTLRAGGKRRHVHLNYLGEHNIVNATGAAALAYGLGVSLPAICRGLGRARPFAMRMQIENWKGVGIINDAYNANPASMNGAVKTLAQLACRGERIAVLGDMFELGKDSRAQHLKLGQAVARARIDAVYLLGREAKEVRNAAIRGGMPAENVVVARDHSELAELLRRRIKRGDWLLFKGSRGMKMEQIIEKLRTSSLE